MATEKKATVVVIGSGIGGAGCAALLAKKGFQVTLLEKNSFSGGKGASFEKEGFTYDTGVHAIGNGIRGPIGEISRRLGGDLEFSYIDPIVINIGGHAAAFHTDFTSDEAISRILDDIGVLPANKEDCHRCMRDMIDAKSDEEMLALETVPLKQYIERFTDDMMFHQMFNGWSSMLLVVTYFTSSTSEFLYAFGHLARNKNLSYPVGGVGRIAEIYLDALKRNGGTVQFESRVDGIAVENGKVRGVSAGDEFFPAEIVISNMGLHATVKMIESDLPSDYVDRAMKYRDSYGAVTIKYALDTKITDVPMLLWVPDITDKEAMSKYVGVMVPVPSTADPGLAPEGGQLILAGGIVGPDPADKEQNEAFLDKMETTMQMLYPGIEEHIIWKMRTDTAYTSRISGRALGEVIGLNQDIRQVGKNRPDPRMPVDNLFLVGADTAGRGIGTEIAAESAINVSALVSGDNDRWSFPD